MFAAASLQEVFTGLGAQFERAHPGTRVEFNFGPSSGLATQIEQGAAVDVFAAASTKTMDQVAAAGKAGSVRAFASNTMAIAVPAGNRAHIITLADLSRNGVKVAVSQAAVPCGVSTAKVLTNAGVRVVPVTQEPDVKAVLTKVLLDEVDAGIVYVTDVKASAGKVTGITIPAGVNASTTYPITTVNTSRNKTTAQAFTDYVLSPPGAQALTAAGFATP